MPDTAGTPWVGDVRARAMQLAARLDGSALAVMGLVAVLVFTGDTLAADPAMSAPNLVSISTKLVTSGQPTKETLSNLAALGFGAVIYLAPPTVADAIPGEADIVRQQGLEFVNIPIKFSDPADADFRSFVAAMERFRDRKVLVHCQVNFRASSMTFLYRVIVTREKPDEAYQGVTRVWAPDRTWMRFLAAQLRQAGVDFEPY